MIPTPQSSPQYNNLTQLYMLTLLFALIGPIVPVGAILIEFGRIKSFRGRANVSHTDTRYH